MRKLVLHTLLSVDGVAESPDRYVFDFDEEMYANLRLRGDLLPEVAQVDGRIVGSGGLVSIIFHTPVGCGRPN